MKGIRSIALTVLLAALAGCATPYQPTGTAGGYYHKALAENTYLVGFSGNGFTDRSTARDFSLLRAAEIGKQLDYDHMVVLGADDQSRTEDVQFGAPTANTYGTVTGNSYNATTTYNSNEVPVFKPKIEISVLYSQGYPQGRHLEVLRISDVIRELKSKHNLIVTTKQPAQPNRPKTTGVKPDAAISAAVSPSRVEFSHKANWFPYKFGYDESIRSVPPTPTSGTLVVTPQDVLFLTWNDTTSRFITTKVIPRQNIQEAVVKSLESGRRLALLADDQANTFELVGRAMNYPKATTEVGSLLADSGKTRVHSGETDVNAKLEMLSDLREKELLTDAEFDSEKKKLLATQ